MSFRRPFFERNFEKIQVYLKISLNFVCLFESFLYFCIRKQTKRVREELCNSSVEWNLWQKYTILPKTPNKQKKKIQIIMKFLKKSDFNRKVLAELAPDDSVIVICDNGSQVASISSMCGHEPRRHPREDVSSYSYRSVQNDGEWIVNITAVPS